MGKINKLIRSLSLVFRQPSLLNKVLEDTTVCKEEVITTYGLSEGLAVVDILTLLPDLNESISPYTWLDGGSLPIDLALLRGLCRKFNQADYFEIGTWRGESASNVSPLCNEVYTLNLSAEEMHNMQLPPAYIEQHAFFSGQLKNIIHLKGNSKSFDFSPYYGKMDVVFIDGDHHPEGVKKDTETAFRLLKNEHSYIVWHDYRDHAFSIRWEVLQGILNGTPESKQSGLYAVSNTLCAIWTSEKLAKTTFAPLQVPDKVFSIDITANSL